MKTVFARVLQALLEAAVVGFPALGAAACLLSTVNAGEDNAISLATHPVRTLDTYHLFTPPDSRSAWERRAACLRDQIRFSAGLLPTPARTPVNPLVTGEVRLPECVIRKVAIQPLPGYYLAGNLYLPRTGKGPFPAILNPHGHWEQGRFTMEPDVPKALPSPASPAGGRANLVAIGVNLARMGFAVFSYDMAGYGDTRQIANHRRFADDPRSWMHGVSEMGLQLWSSIRAVDFVQSLPEVDDSRIGVTGASGGGTQAFLLAAIDSRIKVYAPVNMVSASMQGGCLCENGPGLRLDTDNVEIAALAAPRPQLLVCATGDWTKDVPEREWPALKAVYDLYGDGDKTQAVRFNYGHNFNIESREAVYAWFGRYLKKDPHPERFRERPFTLDPELLRVWDKNHPLPSDALSENALLDLLVSTGEEQLQDLWPRDQSSLKRFRKTLLPGLTHALALPPYDKPDGASGPDVALVVSVEGDSSAREFSSMNADTTRQMVLPAISRPVDEGWESFFCCYNRTPAAERAAAIAQEARRLHSKGAKRVNIVGAGEAGLWALIAWAAAGIPGDAVIDWSRLDPLSDGDLLKRLFIPGFARTGGALGAALLGEGYLTLHNTGPQADLLRMKLNSLGSRVTIQNAALPPSEIARLLRAHNSR